METKKAKITRMAKTLLFLPFLTDHRIADVPSALLPANRNVGRGRNVRDPKSVLTSAISHEKRASLVRLARK
ncbi:MAG: hypothetical protein ABI977_32385 [Acidobacteriota bacterium]